MSKPRRSDLPCKRGRVDDGPGSARSLEMSDGRLVGQKNAPRVDVEIEVPLLVREVGHEYHRGYAGIGAEDVKSSEGCVNGGEALLHAVSDAHIDGKGSCICDGGCRFGSCLIVNIGNGHLYALLSQCSGDR